MSQSQFMVRSQLQSIIQFMMAKGCVESKDFKEFLAQIKGEPLTNEMISQMIVLCNKKLSKFNMMIRSTIDDIAKIEYFILISTVDNDITKAAHHHTPKQFEYFKLLLTNIVASPTRRINEENLEELATLAGIQIKPKNRRVKSEHKFLLDDWCEKKWFAVAHEEETPLMTLGVRSMAELDVFIKQKLT